MLYVKEDGTIQLTRGDTARLEITITNSLTGGDYSLEPEDTLTFTIKKNVKDVTPLIQKTVKGDNIFHIKPIDTKELSFKKYLYDVQLTQANGDVYTVIAPTTFELTSEVTY